MTICEKCGGALEFQIDNNVQGMFCAKCNFSVVTTYIPEIDADESAYEIRLQAPLSADRNNIRIVAEISGFNFLQAKAALQTEGILIFRGKATEVSRAKEKLLVAGITHSISPFFPY